VWDVPPCCATQPSRPACLAPARSLAYAALSFNRDNGFSGKVYSIGTACFYASFMVMMVGGRRV
jgi:hypothetical protein